MRSVLVMNVIRNIFKFCVELGIRMDRKICEDIGGFYLLYVKYGVIKEWFFN